MAAIMPPTLACSLLLCALLAGTAAMACLPDADATLVVLNTVRTRAQSCAPATRPLQWDDRLASSAQRYAEELARRGTLSHQGEGAGSLLDRLKAVGYPLRRAGENLAAGQDDLADVLAQWLTSRAHCENLMQAEFRDVGLACVNGPGGPEWYQTYWVLHLGVRPSDPAQINRP